MSEQLPPQEGPEDRPPPSQQPRPTPGGEGPGWDPSGRAPAPVPRGPQPLRPDEERTWAMLAHLLSLLAAYVGFGFLAPLAVMLIMGPRSAYVRAHAVESLNFNLSWLIYAIVAALLILVAVGIFILIALGVAYVIFVIIASIRAYNGQPYRYPLTIRMVH